MAVNKVVYDDRVLLDISNDTVTEDTLLAGATAHDASGRAISGGVTVGDGKLTVKRNGVEVGSFSANQTTDKEINIEVPSISGLASTSYVDQKVAGIVDSSPEALNTLKELATALGNDANFATTVATNIGKKVDKTTTVNGHALSGNVTVTKSDVGLGNVANERQYSASNPPPTATGTTAGITIVYPAASCSTFSSDSGTVTPAAVQKGAKMFSITRPTKRELTVTNNALVRWDGTGSEVKDSTILIEDVTNSKDGSKGQVLSIPIPTSSGNNKKMVYGYCTDQNDGTSFLGGLFDSSATSFPYNQGLAIGGSSGNLLWKGSKVAVSTDIGTGTLTIQNNGVTAGTFSANATSSKTINIVTPVTIQTDSESQNDVAVIGAEYARLSNGKELLTPDNLGDNVALKNEGTVFIKGTGSTAGTWLGSSDRITSYYDGLSILYKVPVAGASTTTLKINSLAAKTIYLFNTTKLTTQFPVNSILHLVYHESLQSGAWYCNDYYANTQMRVYRQNSSYNADYPLLVSRTKAADIAAPGTNGSSEAVYGVMWDDTTKVPTLNPSTGELKAVKFTGKVTQLDNMLTFEQEGENDVATIHAYGARLADGDRLVAGYEFDDFVDSQSSKGVVDGKGYIIIDKEEAPTGVTISDGTSGSSTLSLRVEEDELDSNQILVSQFADANISGNNVTFTPTFDSAGGSMPIIRIVYQTAKKSGTYNIRLSFSHKGSVTSQRPNEVLIWLNGTVVQVLTLTNGSTHNIPIPNVKAGDHINAAFYATVTSGATFNNYEATLKNICFSCEESLQSVANKSKLNPSYERAIIAASSNTQNLKATYYQGLNATLEKFRQAIIALGGTV